MNKRRLLDYEQKCCHIGTPIKTIEHLFRSMSSMRMSSGTLVLLMILSVMSPFVQADTQMPEDLKTTNSLFPHDTPTIDALSPELQWSIARANYPVATLPTDFEPRDWIIITKSVESLTTITHSEKITPVTFLENFYTVPGDSIDIRDLRILQDLNKIELFYPDDPGLEPVSMSVPNDPLVTDQWHLINTGQDGSQGVDLNITGAWDRYNGSGVLIRIIDDGLDVNHEDLQANHDQATSYDYCDNDPDPSPVETSDNHGTAVAGVAAGIGNNNIGIAGVAWGASHNHARFLCGGSVVPALSDFNQVIDVYHNSWGYGGAGYQGLSPSSAAMLQAGAYEGRSSLGSIFTFSAGNEYTADENVNQKGFQKSRYTIAIGAVTYAGVQSWYSSIGAPVLVVGPSNGGSLGITTADRTGAEGYSSTNYTNTFGGTSSSGPKVAGLTGLILEADPSLTWRDIQGILVHSSTKNDPSHENWSVNGAGLPVSHYYGFGMVDATAAVNLAENWTYLGPEVNVSSPLYTPSVNIPSSGSPLSFSHTFNDMVNIESVELFMDIDHPDPEDLIITLTSPEGYTSILADTNPADYGNMRFHDMVSMHHYDEISSGTWTIEILDVNPSASDGTVNNWQLVVHGTEADADGDGWTDEEEALCGSLLSDPISTPSDIDEDGTCDAMDDDVDGDSWINVAELACGTDPYDSLSTPISDTDLDGLCDDVDMDDDGDGIEDNMDAFPLDGQAWNDTDSDGMADETYKPVCCNYESEDFENPSINSTFQFELGSPPIWIRNNSASNTGNYSMRAGQVSDSSASTISMTLSTGEANGSFALKVDSETNYDFLVFYINEIQIESWSGNVDWTTFSFELTAGTNVLKWSYIKDYTVSSGLDTAWIDDISLPTSLFMTNPETTDFGTNRDHDDDNDGVDDELDQFPLDGSESADFDEDGIGDNSDLDDDNDGWLDLIELQCGFDPRDNSSVPSDYDQDTVCDFLDPDDDNDGYSDTVDDFPLNTSEWVDSDLDGLGDNFDLDDDDDGYNDTDDDFPLDPSEWDDLDGDGVGSNEDTDDDGDGVLDIDDAFPNDQDEFIDTDFDGVGDNADTDDDGDGVLDVNDIFPLNSTEWSDFDLDGLGDNSDEDDDNDGIDDSDDMFPNDQNEYVDTDSDGLGDNADTDDDGDGTPDVNDAFPLDPLETIDTDSDGIGDNTDIDDDGDGVQDEQDAFPKSPAESVDSDGDGLGDNADTDDDGDSIPDFDDIFPLNAGEWSDLDMDGIGDNADSDDDGDNVSDVDDAFPSNSDEWSDFDIDGIGDNADFDDDGDDVDDESDNCPETTSVMGAADANGCAAQQRDTDGDGITDDLDSDDDGDGWTDIQEVACGFPELDSSTSPIDTDDDGLCDVIDQDDDDDGVLDSDDAFPLDGTETIDSDEDGIGDNSDSDDDNDGVLDSDDAYPLDSSRTFDERILMVAIGLGSILGTILVMTSLLGFRRRPRRAKNEDIQIMLEALEE